MGSTGRQLQTMQLTLIPYGALDVFGNTTGPHSLQQANGGLCLWYSCSPCRAPRRHSQEACTAGYRCFVCIISSRLPYAHAGHRHQQTCHAHMLCTLCTAPHTLFGTLAKESNLHKPSRGSCTCTSSTRDLFCRSGAFSRAAAGSALTVTRLSMP